MIIFNQVMSEEKIQNHEDIKGSRRSRKDDEGRDYICGCGKKYLSYPALYTHIKTKHQGQQPEGTQKTGVPSNTKRNRQKAEQRLCKQIEGLILQQQLKILQEIGQDAQGFIEYSQRIKTQEVGKPIWEAYFSLTKKSDLNLDKKTDLATILVIYLVGVGNYVSEKMYRFYKGFAKNFLSCYLTLGEEVYETCFKGESQSRIRSISIQDCKFAPLIADFFIRYYLPEYQVTEQTIEIYKYICADFCHWMKNKKLSIVEAHLNHQYKLINRSILEGLSNREMSRNGNQHADEKQESMNDSGSQLQQSENNEGIKGLSVIQNNSEDRGDNIDDLFFNNP